MKLFHILYGTKVTEAEVCGKGYSMYPTIKPNDRLFISPAVVDDVNPGEIIAFFKQGEMIAHRVISKAVDPQQGVFLRALGDNNTYPDLIDITDENLIGVVTKAKRGRRFFYPQKKQLSKQAKFINTWAVNLSLFWSRWVMAKINRVTARIIQFKPLRGVKWLLSERHFPVTISLQLMHQNSTRWLINNIQPAALIAEKQDFDSYKSVQISFSKQKLTAAFFTLVFLNKDDTQRETWLSHVFINRRYWGTRLEQAMMARVDALLRLMDIKEVYVPSSSQVNRMHLQNLGFSLLDAYYAPPEAFNYYEYLNQQRMPESHYLYPLRTRADILKRVIPPADCKDDLALLNIVPGQAVQAAPLQKADKKLLTAWRLAVAKSTGKNKLVQFTAEQIQTVREQYYLSYNTAYDQEKGSFQQAYLPEELPEGDWSALFGDMCQLNVSDSDGKGGFFILKHLPLASGLPEWQLEDYHLDEAFADGVVEAFAWQALDEFCTRLGVGGYCYKLTGLPTEKLDPLCKTGFTLAGKISENEAILVKTITTGE